MAEHTIKLLFMDVDGTLTDSHIYISNEGECMKAFNVKDGYGILCLLSQSGIVPVIITGRYSEIVKVRAGELGIKELYQGVENKLRTLKAIVEKYDLLPENVAYIGDDLNDLDCIRYCGLSACPSDAVREVKEACDYVCHLRGGKGAVREFIDHIMKNCQ